MFIQHRREKQFAKLCSAHPTAFALERAEFNRAFNVAYLLHLVNDSQRNHRDLQQNQQIVLAALELVSFRRWCTYAEAMNTWTLEMRRDPALFEHFSLDQLRESAHIIKPAPLQELFIDLPERRTGLFRCPRCSSKNTDHTMLQTRSADEAMSVFAYCQDCGLRWKK